MLRLKSLWALPALSIPTVAVPLDDVPHFCEQVSARVKKLILLAKNLYISHLGDGNLHYTFYPSDTVAVSKNQSQKLLKMWYWH